MTQRPSLRPSPGRGGRQNGVLLVLLMLLSPLAARAEPELRLRRPGPQDAAGQPSFTLAGFLDGELRESLESGLPATIILRWSLRESRDGWWDRRVDQGFQLYRIYHDLLESTFELFDARGRSVALCADLEELETALAQWRALTLPDALDLDSRRRYRLQVEVRLEPLPADEIRDLERWLRGSEADRRQGILGGLSSGADQLLRRMSGLGDRRAEAVVEFGPEDP